LLKKLNYLLFLFLNIHYLLRKSSIRSSIGLIKYIKEYLAIKHLKKNIYDIYLKVFVGVIIQKKFNYLIKHEKAFLLNKYKFKEPDWFSHNIPLWNWILSNYKFKKKINYLEIGVFEGRSLFFIYEKLKNINITAVDPYKDYTEIKPFLKNKISLVFKNFKKNIKKFKVKVDFFKIKSSKFFKINKKKFDIIYIDGSHFYLDVLKDLKNSLNIINNEGIIILDDFSSNHYDKIYENPIGGILPILENKKNEIIAITKHQIYFKIKK